MRKKWQRHERGAVSTNRTFRNSRLVQLPDHSHVCLTQSEDNSCPLQCFHLRRKRRSEAEEAKHRLLLFTNFSFSSFGQFLSLCPCPVCVAPWSPAGGAVRRPFPALFSSEWPEQSGRWESRWDRPLNTEHTGGLEVMILELVRDSPGETHLWILPQWWHTHPWESGWTTCRGRQRESLVKTELQLSSTSYRQIRALATVTEGVRTNLCFSVNLTIIGDSSYRTKTPGKPWSPIRPLATFSCLVTENWLVFNTCGREISDGLSKDFPPH